MKKGIVINVSKNKALVMLNGGEFVNVRAKKDWKKGSVVTLERSSLKTKSIVAVAACLVILFTSVLFSYNWYYDEVTVISVDINPSFELGVNCLEKVITLTDYNKDGAVLLDTVQVKGLHYQEAIQVILNSEEMQKYLNQNDALSLAAYSKKDNQKILNVLEKSVEEAVSSSYPEVQISCKRADAQTAYEAHRHGMTTGKYLAVKELQELSPNIEISDYESVGIRVINEEIYECRRQQKGEHHQKGSNNQQSGRQNQSESSSSGEGKQRGKSGGLGNSAQNSQSNSRNGADGISSSHHSEDRRKGYHK